MAVVVTTATSSFQCWSMWTKKENGVFEGKRHRHSVRLINKIWWKQSWGFAEHNAIKYIYIYISNWKGLADARDIDEWLERLEAIDTFFPFSIQLAEKWQFPFAHMCNLTKLNFYLFINFRNMQKTATQNTTSSKKEKIGRKKNANSTAESVFEMEFLKKKHIFTTFACKLFVMNGSFECELA